jgi:hypothetical protein
MREIHKFVPITKAKNNLLEIIRQVEKVVEIYHVGPRRDVYETLRVLLRS